MRVGHAGRARVIVNGHRYVVPPWASALVAAVVHDRRAGGVGAGDRLFVDRSGGEGLEPRQAATLLDQVADRTGIRFRLPSVLPEWAPPASWLSLDALRLVEIGDPPRRISPWLAYD